MRYFLALFLASTIGLTTHAQDSPVDLIQIPGAAQLPSTDINQLLKIHLADRLSRLQAAVDAGQITTEQAKAVILLRLEMLQDRLGTGGGGGGYLAPIQGPVQLPTQPGNNDALRQALINQLRSRMVQGMSDAKAEREAFRVQVDQNTSQLAALQALGQARVVAELESLRNRRTNCPTPQMRVWQISHPGLLGRIVGVPSSVQQLR